MHIYNGHSTQKDIALAISIKMLSAMSHERLLGRLSHETTIIRFVINGWSTYNARVIIDISIKMSGECSTVPCPTVPALFLGHLGGIGLGSLQT